MCTLKGKHGQWKPNRPFTHNRLCTSVVCTRGKKIGYNMYASVIYIWCKVQLNGCSVVWLYDIFSSLISLLNVTVDDWIPFSNQIKAPIKPTYSKTHIFCSWNSPAKCEH